MEQDYWLPTYEGGRIRMKDIIVISGVTETKYGAFVYVTTAAKEQTLKFSSEKAANDFIRNRFPTIELEG